MGQRKVEGANDSQKATATATAEGG